MAGTPMSATFIANGCDALLLGFNELLVRPFGSHPFVFCGCVGPVAVTADLARRIGHAACLLSAEFGPSFQVPDFPPQEWGTSTGEDEEPSS